MKKKPKSVIVRKLNIESMEDQTVKTLCKPTETEAGIDGDDDENDVETS